MIIEHSGSKSFPGEISMASKGSGVRVYSPITGSDFFSYYNTMEWYPDLGWSKIFKVEDDLSF
jgi:hypothetical protein